ncbi:MAG: cryptochrome/photolyase family protein [Anaerolineae bacterium]|jgi:deoxyribodipyrimidine photolyase-related protein
MAERHVTPARHLVLLLGDQLDIRSAAFDGFDKQADVVWMAEVPGEAEHVWATKPHIAIFLSAMRHFRDHLRAEQFPVDYRRLDDPDNRGTLGTELRRAVEARRPKKAIVVQPGEWRVHEQLLDAAEQGRVPLEIRPDRHFLCPPQVFEEHIKGRRQLLMEHFYREMRRRTGVLVDGKEPVGGQWNYDAENRVAFGKQGPDDLPAPISFEPDAVTQEVLNLVRERFGDHPGSLGNFDWPVTREQARDALRDFIRHRLPAFGTFQDAIWTGEPYLYHSRLSAVLNLKLLDPREAIKAAEQALRDGQAPLNAVEGFIRQILGWREYVRGVYWHHMPDYAALNALGADVPLPEFYWTAETEMNCLQHCIRQTLNYGYAHHIRRLMVTGLFALLLGVEPQQVHEWYLAVYVDAVEWVEMPNTLGMSQFADGGIVASKPYCASGSYIKRMSNYCRGCPYRSARRLGDEACLFTTLYWDFLMRHEERLSGNRRMGLQLYNLRKIDPGERRAIRRQASQVRKRLTSG